MHSRRAVEADFEKIFALEDENLVSKLSLAEQKQDGFLSGSFSVEQLANFNADSELGIIICAEADPEADAETDAEIRLDTDAEKNDKLMGFLVTSRPEANPKASLPGAMVARFPNIRFEGHSLDSFKALIGGPVCVAKEYRGKGVFEELYRALPAIVDHSYELAVVLVSTNNPRSIHAHEKVGMETIDKFEFGGRDFLTLAKRLRKPVSGE